jgi:glycosyltransferase involved in cell wall biosynthesis
MNVIFDKKTLRVVSLLDTFISPNSEQEVLQSMFPKDFNRFSLWSIDQNISQGLAGLSIKMDNDRPKFLLYKGKIIYEATKEDDKKRNIRTEKEKDKALSQILPRSIRTSITSSLIKLWINSPFTRPDIVRSLNSLEYFSQDKILPVEWWGNFIDAGGYGNMNRSFLFRLHNYHILAKADVIPTIPQISEMGQYYVRKHASINYRRLNRYVKICSFGPHAQTKRGGAVVFFTMMETETLHPAFRNMCNGYADEIWVPSSHNKRVFTESGIKKPIYLMPLGIDETVYANADTAVPKDLSKMNVCDILGKPVSQGINSFRFFTLLGWSLRKGTDILIKSFVRAFKGSDDVALIIYSNHVGPEQVRSEAIPFAKTVRSSDYPQILFIPGVTPEKEMSSLYKVGHAFIHTSRGEGFSLAQIEASACGLPVISCNNTGMSEYLRDDNAFLIKTNEVELKPEINWISPFYGGQLFPKLGEDQIVQAVNHMRFVVDNYDNALEKNKILKAEVFQKYTWDKATERVSERIRQIS